MITISKLLRETRKHFGLPKDHDFLVYVFKNYVGYWQVLNISDIHCATQEQLEFMVALVNREGGLKRRNGKEG